jgi:HEAT repeat protein
MVFANPGSAARTERILQRVGQDGVDAVVDQYNGARTMAERQAYREVLSRLPLAREALVQMLQDSRWYIVRQAAEFLGEMGGEEVERPLAELLRHPDERVRRTAARALAHIESSFTLDAIARALTDSSPRVRLEATTALSSRKGGRAGSMLVKAIDSEEDSEVQYAILAALGRVATTESVQKLSRAAEAASGLFASRKNVGLRVAAVHALGDAHTPGAMAALQSLASDKDKDVRDAVARTLLLLRGSAA